MTQANTHRGSSSRIGRWAGVFFLLALFGAGIAAPALAQDEVTVREELLLTDRGIERAVERMLENQCDRGGALLRQANTMQRVAWADFRGNTLDGFRSALTKTRRARGFASDAIAACQVDLQVHEEASSLFESVRASVTEARAELRERPDAEAERLLNAGEHQLENAVEAYRAKEFRQAVRMGTIANNLVQRALQRFRDDTPTFGGEDVEAELSETETLIREVESAGLGPRAQKLLEQAKSHQEKARDFFADAEFTKALRWTRAARVKAQEASQNVSLDRPERARVERAIEAIGDMIQEYDPKIREQGAAGTVALLEKAEESLVDAREQLRDDQVVVAARSARLAGSLLRRAAEKAGVR